MKTSDQSELQTLSDASRYLEGLINYERRPGFSYERLGLEPIRALLDRLDRPEQSLSVIHVAGSKGKGSTCLFSEAILLELGEHVGTFTSPHLESWLERFRIDAKPVSEARLVAAVRRVRPIVEELRRGPSETLPSFFDATTAVAFLLFAEAGVDRALIEVGLGGRLDSTNVVDPAVACITSIELEHTDKLGETEALIAGEKAGILKPGRPAVLGFLRPEAAAVIRARAQQVGARLIARDEHFELTSTSDGSTPSSFSFRETAPAPSPFEFEVGLRVPGEAAIANAGLAIACVRALGAHPATALQDAAAKALADCVLPARIEVLENDPEVIVDAAHTADSARVLADALTTLAPNGIELILSVSTDKNLDALLDALLPLTRRVWVTVADRNRSLPADALAKQIRERSSDLMIEIVVDAEDAARRARSELAPGLRLCAAGSVYLAGVVRRVLGPVSEPG
jgi:dihydrofolate synthase/folylpolyglutamate synthase